MKQFIIALALFLAFGGSAHANTAKPKPATSSLVVARNGQHLWVHPGHHPLADNREGVMNDTARRSNFIKLGLSGQALEEVMKATAVHGQMRDLVDGEMLGNQLYQNGKMVRNIVVAFGAQRVDRSAERWTVRLADGTVIEITLPYICHNLSVRVIPLECGYVMSEIRPGDEHLQYALMGDYNPDACFAVAEIPQAQTSASSINWQALPVQCPEEPCSFAGYADYFHLPLTQSGGVSVSPGFVVIRVSLAFARNPSNVVVECLDHGVRAMPRHSCGIDVHPADYHQGRWDHQATIFYGRDEISTKWRYRKLWWAMPDTAGNCNPAD